MERVIYPSELLPLPPHRKTPAAEGKQCTTFPAKKSFFLPFFEWEFISGSHDRSEKSGETDAVRNRSKIEKKLIVLL